MSKTVTRQPRPFRKRRPARVIQLGRRIHPEQVADAWYAAGCPESPWRPPISAPMFLRWRFACLLRGC